MTLGDRVAVLQDGQLQQVAPPMEIYPRPVNHFVAGFVGSASMNHAPAVGESVGARLPRRAIHLFDADSGARLGPYSTHSA